MKVSLFDMAKQEWYRIRIPCEATPAGRLAGDAARELWIEQHCRASDWTVVHTSSEQERADGKCFANYYFTNLTEATYFKLAFS